MSETFHDRVEQCIAALKTSPRAISLSAGLDPGYVSKLLKRRSMPNGRSLPLIANALKVTEAYLLSGGASGPRASAKRPHIRMPGSESRTIVRDLPLRRASSSLRGDGLFQLPGSPAEMLFRPPALEPFPNAYAFVVPNASLRPQLAPGDLAVACPEKPTAMSDAVIVHLREASGDADCLIGILSDDIGHTVSVVLHGHETAKTHETAAVTAVHKILSLAEILGAGQ